jgi:hypothetical protein
MRRRRAPKHRGRRTGRPGVSRPGGRGVRPDVRGGRAGSGGRQQEDGVLGQARPVRTLGLERQDAGGLGGGRSEERDEVAAGPGLRFPEREIAGPQGDAGARLRPPGDEPAAVGGDAHHVEAREVGGCRPVRRRRPAGQVPDDVAGPALVYGNRRDGLLLPRLGRLRFPEHEGHGRRRRRGASQQDRRRLADAAPENQRHVRPLAVSARPSHGGAAAWERMHRHDASGKSRGLDAAVGTFLEACRRFAARPQGAPAVSVRRSRRQASHE